MCPNSKNICRKNKRIALEEWWPDPSRKNVVGYRRHRESNLIEGTPLTLSQAGIFIQSIHFPEKGDHLFLGFEFCHLQIQCTGKVLYVNRVGCSFRPQGFGVKFTRLLKQDHQFIKRTIDQISLAQDT